VPVVSALDLDQLASTLRVVRESTGVLEPGAALRVHLEPDPASLTASLFASGPFGATFITKQVLFMDHQVESSLEAATLNPRILGGVPIPVTTPAPATDTTPPAPLPGTTTPPAPGSAQTPAGVPGLLGQITGSVPFRTEVPVSVEAEWSVTDSAGAALGSSDFAAPDGLTSLSATLVMAPELFEASAAVPAPTSRVVVAKVRLAAAGITGSWVTLPSVPVSVAPLGIPTVAALFRHTNFSGHHNNKPGFVLVVVPGGALSSTAAVVAALGAIRSALAPLQSIARFATIYAGLGSISSAISAQPHLQFRSAASIPNLNAIEMISHWRGDVEAEDQVSALAVVGMPGRAVKFYNDRDFKGASITLTVGQELHALVTWLNTANPSSSPAGAISVQGGASSYADSISSMSF